METTELTNGATGHDGLPEQEALYRPSARFGHVPAVAEPLGWSRTQPNFTNHYPTIRLPIQEIERISVDPSMSESEPNRLIWGDNLHIMRELPNDSIDLIYIDPPFFSNREYNVMWGDENEKRSFSDVWEGGPLTYLIWLNARLWEMKRLLTPTGAIFVHCDWHAAHYIKVELDKIFNYENMVSEIIWAYGSASGGRAAAPKPVKGHETIFWYAKSYGDHFYNKQYTPYSEKYITERFNQKDENSRAYRTRKRKDGRIARQYLDESPGVPLSTVWSDIKQLYAYHWIKRREEEVGYPTQKPEALMERIIRSASNPGDTVADFFSGGGGFPVVAQRLGRRWIATDQSRLAISVTAERLKEAAQKRSLGDSPIPDFTVSHWGIYEAEELANRSEDDFRQFVLDCYGDWSLSDVEGIHAFRDGSPSIALWVGPPSYRELVTSDAVLAFARAIAALPEARMGALPTGVMLAWGFDDSASTAVAQLTASGESNIALVQLQQVTLESKTFRQRVSDLSTTRADYSEFLTFVQPPIVEIAYRSLGAREYEFDAGDSIMANPSAQVLNVLWDFDYRPADAVFQANRGSWYQKISKGTRNSVGMTARHTFPSSGRFAVACRVLDDKGGIGMKFVELQVE